MLTKSRFEWRKLDTTTPATYYIFDTFIQDHAIGYSRVYKTQRQAGLIAKHLNDEYNASIEHEGVTWNLT